MPLLFWCLLPLTLHLCLFHQSPKVSPPLFLSSPIIPSPSPHVPLFSSPWNFSFHLYSVYLSYKSLPILFIAHSEFCVSISMAVIRLNQNPGPGYQAHYPPGQMQIQRGKGSEPKPILFFVQRRGKEFNSCRVKCFPLSLIHRQRCLVVQIVPISRAKGRKNLKVTFLFNIVTPYENAPEDMTRIREPKLGLDQMNTEGRWVLGLEQGIQGKENRAENKALMPGRPRFESYTQTLNTGTLGRLFNSSKALFPCWENSKTDLKL